VERLPFVGILLFAAIPACGAAPDPGGSTNGVSQSPAELAKQTFGHPGDDDGDADDRGHLAFRPGLCGGKESVDCGTDGVCYPIFSRECPGAKQIGVCFPRPHLCPPISKPVCGCDGQTYSNLCDAARHGTAVDHEGACPVVPKECGAGGDVCPGSGTCVQNQCQCDVVQQCQRGETFDTNPVVCACVAQSADPCARVQCMTGMQCVAQPDGTTTCEPSN
jgi:hypothetical protein